jgi:hypothetical protein
LGKTGYAPYPPLDEGEDDLNENNHQQGRTGTGSPNDSIRAIKPNHASHPFEFSYGD